MTELVSADYWSPKELAMLSALGVENASREDLAVFHRVAERTGLDPFARQIHMVQRKGRWTIQTGIDGYRVVAHRVAERRGVGLSISAPQWCGEDGVWREVWFASTPPAAAKVTVILNGDPFPAVALWAEYVQLTRDGAVTAIWRERGAGQLAKCAEALALRKACPADLSGVLTSEEMEHSTYQAAPARAVATVADLAPEGVNLVTGEVVEAMLDMDSALGQELQDALAASGCDPAAWLTLCGSMVRRELTSPGDLTETEAREIAARLVAGAGDE